LQDLRINLNYSDPQDAEDTRGNINQAFIQVFVHSFIQILFVLINSDNYVLIILYTYASFAQLLMNSFIQVFMHLFRYLWHFCIHSGTCVSIHLGLYVPNANRDISTHSHRYLCPQSFRYLCVNSDSLSIYAFIQYGAGTYAMMHSWILYLCILCIHSLRYPCTHLFRYVRTLSLRCFENHSCRCRNSCIHAGTYVSFVLLLMYSFIQVFMHTLRYLCKHSSRTYAFMHHANIDSCNIFYYCLYCTVLHCTLLLLNNHEQHHY
jgi:hypothetical protein